MQLIYIYIPYTMYTQTFIRRTIFTHNVNSHTHFLFQPHKHTDTMLSLGGGRQQHPGPLIAILPLLIPFNRHWRSPCHTNKVSYIVNYPYILSWIYPSFRYFSGFFQDAQLSDGADELDILQMDSSGAY